MKIKDLAKELGLTSKALIVQLKSLEIEVKNQDTVLDKNKINMIRKLVSESKSANLKHKKIALKSKAKPADKTKKKVKEVKIKKSAKKVTPKAKAVKRPRNLKRALISEEKPQAPVIEQLPPSEIKEKETEPIPIEVAPPLEKEKIAPVTPEVPKKELKILELDLPITVKDLAVKLQEKPSVLIQRIMKKGLMVGINQALEDQVAKDICDSYGFQIKKTQEKEEVILARHKEKDLPQLLTARAPVVTLMGHVDHGKTSLLDAIRESRLTQLEYGGITQHIGAYRVDLPKGSVTFLDTPGHEAFTAMRARGARITDIVILVVAADDGIMPQTVEAIDHAREAGVPIIVAINKIDKIKTTIDKIKKQLSEYNLVPEEWKGTTIMVPVSAKTKEGINELLEMILLEAEMLELKTNPQRQAMGVVVESKLKKGKGYVSTLLVQNGTLHLNDNFIVGKFYGKVKAMFDDCGRTLTTAGPSVPVEVLGIVGAPEGGEQFFVVEDEKQAKEVASDRQEKERLAQIKTVKRISLDDLYAEIKAGKVKELKLILKADVAGSLEAIKESIKKIDTAEIKIEIIHQATGPINISDVVLASASNALILGFHVAVDEKAKDLIQKEGIDVRTYNVIYELSNDLKSALEGMLEPEVKKIFLGKAEVRKVFQLSRSGTVAGCFVLKGKIPRNAEVSLLRNGQATFHGKISSLKRFKDDVREATEGFECGISITGFEDLKAGDIIEAYQIQHIARKL